MIDISRKAYEKNGVETITDSDGILWLNKKHVEEGLDYTKMRVTTVKYPSGYRNQCYEPVDEPKKTTQQNFYTQRISKLSNHGL